MLGQELNIMENCYIRNGDSILIIIAISSRVKVLEMNKVSKL